MLVLAAPGEVVVLHQHRAEVTRQERLALAADLVRALLVPDPRRLVLQVVGEAVVEDVVGQGDVVIGREDHSSRRQAHIDALRMTAAILRRSDSLRAGRAKWLSALTLSDPPIGSIV